MCSGIGWSAMPLNTNGITEMWVTPWRCTTSQNRDAEYFGCSTTVEPTPRVDQIDQLCALTWKNGR